MCARMEDIFTRAPSLLTLAGSRLHGTSDENSDIDLRGVYCLPTVDILGLSPCEKALVGPPDCGYDVILWEAQHFIDLALKANPHVFEVLFSPQFLCCDRAGDVLLSLKEPVLSQRIRQSFGGFAVRQLRVADNLATRLRVSGRNDPDLELYRGKFHKTVRHIFRTLLYAIDLLETGKMRVNLDREELEAFVLPIDEVHKAVLGMVQQMDRMTSKLPQYPDRQEANRALLKIRDLWYDPKTDPGVCP